MLVDELLGRNYSQSTVRSYIHVIEDFSKHFHRSPDRLGPDHIRQYQAHLFRDRKLLAGTIISYVAACGDVAKLHFATDCLALKASSLQSNIGGQSQTWRPGRQDWRVHIGPTRDTHTLCIA
jgi:hypothetical protein